MFLNPFYEVYKKWFSSDNLDDRKRCESKDFVHTFENLTDDWVKHVFKIKHGMDFTCLEIRCLYDCELAPYFKIEDGANGEAVFSYGAKESFITVQNFAGPGTVSNGILTEPKYFRWVFGSDGIIILKAKRNPLSINENDSLSVLITGVQFKADGSTID